MHDVAEEIGWTHKNGMAASSLENDYVHKTVARLSETFGVTVEYAIVNTAAFERDFLNFDIMRLKQLKDFNPDYIIFQFGENVSQEELLQNESFFIENYTKLIEYFGECKKIVCTPFWYSKEKVYAITQVALNTNSFLVDLSHLDGRFDPSNYVKAEVQFKHPGVAIHPGDLGMKRISDCIFSIFNADMH